MKKRALYEIPICSTSFTQEASVDFKSDPVVIKYAYRINDIETIKGIGFYRVYAFRTKSELCCSPWDIEGAYDTLNLIEDSNWISELKSGISDRFKSDWNPNHYLIYLDSVGSFEFIAESWVLLDKLDFLN